MEKRVILFLVLSLVILFGYDLVLKEFGYSPFSPSSIPEEIEISPSATPDKKKLPDDVSLDEVPGEPEAMGPGGETDPSNRRAQVEEIDTPLYHAKMTNEGAQILSWKLKQFLVQSQDEPGPIELVYSEGHFPGPLTLALPDQELTQRLQKGIYEVHRDFSVLDEDHPTGNLTYTYRLPEEGIWIQKELTFHHDTYVVDVSVKTEGFSQGLDVLLGTNFGVVEWGQGFIGLLGPAWKIGDDVEKEAPEPMLRKSGDVQWAALQDKYFLSAIIPNNGAEGVFAKAEAERVVSAGVQFSGDSGTQEHEFRLYAGPKQFDILKDFEIDLEETIDFGWFIYGSWAVVKAVAKPLFYVLRFLYDFTNNYGFSIILLTVGIKILFVPLQYKSSKSMKGMQQIQPKVAALQEKYKEDREHLNKELMKLYKEHKVNPVGGCLPMFLQMPVFVALFNILYMTIDLRQAPFILWISDLSIQDPYYVLPVLMGASMVIQQKIMPTTMDPAQAKMMLLLPVFLTFLFVTFPAGLVLYWLTNNVLTIIQQFVTDRYIFKRPTFSSTPVEKVQSSPENQESGKKKQKGEKNRKEKEKR